MARIAGVDLPRTKRVEIGLTYIYGIGRHRSGTILTEAGVSPDRLAELHGPVGLDLGGRAPGETALAILAEIVADRYGGSGVPMRQRVVATAG